MESEVWELPLALGVILLFALGSYWAKKLDALGAASGFVIALGIYLGGGYLALLQLFLFFVLGVGASKWKEKEKASMNLAQEQEGIRSWGNAWGNGGVAALAGYCLFFYPNQLWLLPLLGGSLAGATADTLSSELGNVYGKRYFDILTFKAGKKGENGIVSLEGTMSGIIGAAIIASCLPEYFLAIWLGGIAGTVIDSLLGATIERKGWVGNDVVNFLSCLGAGLTACFIKGTF